MQRSTSDVFRAREPRSHPKTCKKLKSFSVPKITENLKHAHRKNGAVLLQNVTRLLWAHTSTRESIFDPGSKADRVQELRVALEKVHTNNGAVLLQTVTLTPWAHRGPGCFRAGTHTHKDRRCFAAECDLEPFEHTLALEGPSFDPGLKADKA